MLRIERDPYEKLINFMHMLCDVLQSYMIPFRDDSLHVVISMKYDKSLLQFKLEFTNTVINGASNCYHKHVDFDLDVSMTLGKRMKPGDISRNR